MTKAHKIETLHEVLRGKDFLPRNTKTFRPIPWAPAYLINAQGTVIGRKGKPLSPRKETPRYRFVKIDGITWSVHCLVWTVFVGDIKNKLQVNHVDGVKGHDALRNLELGTQAYNSRHAADAGLLNTAIGEKSGRATLTERQARKAIRLINAGYDNQHVASELGVRRSVISEIRRGNSWTHLGPRDQKDSTQVIRMSVDDRMKAIGMILKGQLSNQDIADRFNVSATTIYLARKQKIWPNEWARLA